TRGAGEIAARVWGKQVAEPRDWAVLRCGYHPADPRRIYVRRCSLPDRLVELVRLVEHCDRVVRERPPGPDEACRVDVVVRNDEVRAGGARARPLGEALVAGRATVAAWALVASDRDATPRGVWHVGAEFIAITGLGDLGPLDQPPVGGGNALALGLGEALQADIGAAALEHSPGQLSPERVFQCGQVPASYLLLQGLRRGGNHCALPGQNRGNQIRKRLANARPGLDHQVMRIINSRGDRSG